MFNNSDGMSCSSTNYQFPIEDMSWKDNLNMLRLFANPGDLASTACGDR